MRRFLLNMAAESVLVVGLVLSVSAATNDYSPVPPPDITAHNQGNLQLALTNTGRFGDTIAYDPLSNDSIFLISFPRDSRIVFRLEPRLIIGGIVDNDTIVSDFDFDPDPYPHSTFAFQTKDPTRASYSPEARSDLDILCWYNDTTMRDEISDYYHQPMGLAVFQRSSAWAAERLRGVILVECVLTNVGIRPIKNVYTGFFFYALGAAFDDGLATERHNGLVGFLGSYPSHEQCGIIDHPNVVYLLDNDGNPENGNWSARSARGAVGISILQFGGPQFTLSFNWETGRPNGPAHFDPTMRGHEIPTWSSPMAGYYRKISNGEVDYDQMTTAVDHSFQGYQPPPPDAAIIADGELTFGEFTAGPVDLSPGEECSFVFAIVAGDSVHVLPTDYENLWDPYHPYWLYSSLDFSRLATNARWAGWVYDNPGVDTDGDGYFGKFTMCDGDTFWYEGDRVPDWRADVPPSAPLVRVYPENGKLTIRWNGYYSQMTPDPFTRVKDFEGYRVYMGLDTRLSSLGLLTSWDADNYQRYKLIQLQNGNWEWKATELPLSLDSLRILYDDPDFEPTIYTRDHPLVVNDTFYRFEAQDFNQSSLTRPDGIRKAYPDAVYPPDDTTLWTDDMLTSEHGRDLPKYYEYEYSIDNLLPTVEYQVVVTAFDFGFALGGLPAQESSKLNNLIAAYALPTPDAALADKLKVYVWPNPYRYDGNYEAQGFENRDQTLWYDRARRINFGNLPAKCTISILSLDGDLVKEIHHNYSPDDPEASHDYWDLITRNTQLAVSGIYYWVIESSQGNQIGKIVVIE